MPDSSSSTSSTTTTTLPAGTIATYDADGTGTALTSATTLDAITTDDQAQDFAVTGTGSLGDLVWTDDDADETKDTAEFGTDGVVVAIVYTDPTSGLTFSDEVTTDADGGYGFYNIPAGEVAVTVDTGTLPAGSRPARCFRSAARPMRPSSAGPWHRGAPFKARSACWCMTRSG